MWIISDLQRSRETQRILERKTKLLDDLKSRTITKDDYDIAIREMELEEQIKAHQASKVTPWSVAEGFAVNSIKSMTNAILRSAWIQVFWKNDKK